MNLIIKDTEIELSQEQESELFTGILLSLFCDGEAEAEDLEAYDTDRKGYWGDLLEDSPFKLGSRLWTLKRQPKNDESLLKAEQFVKEALKWTIKDGHIKNIDVKAAWTGESLSIHINLDQDKLDLKYKWGS
ncbi:MAG: phage GP46 family protein [Oligoflexales bacterium]